MWEWYNIVVILMQSFSTKLKYIYQLSVKMQMFYN